MPSMTALNDGLYPIIENAFKNNPNSIKKFQSAVSAYLDKNMNKLSSSGPVYRTLFTETDKNIVFEATTTSPELVNKVLPESAYIKNHWKNIASPFNVVCALIITYAKRNKNEDLANFAVMYLTLSMYPSLHYKYFPYEPNQQIMDYTINNLSNKYKIKQLGTIWNALLDTAQVCDKTYSRNITRATDKDITDYIEAIKTRLNALLKKIKNEFQKNYNDKNIMNIESDYEDENTISTSESNSYIIERYANAISMKLSMSGPDMKLVSIASRMNNISINELRSVTTQLVSAKENAKDIKQLFTDILTTFLTVQKHSITQVKSSEFLIECLAIYKKSNTIDKNITRVKKLLEKWLNMYSEKYKKSNRVATLNNFKKALYTFFVITIQANINAN